MYWPVSKNLTRRSHFSSFQSFFNSITYLEPALALKKNITMVSLNLNNNKEWLSLNPFNYSASSFTKFKFLEDWPVIVSNLFYLRINMSSTALKKNKVKY